VELFIKILPGYPYVEIGQVYRTLHEDKCLGGASNGPKSVCLSSENVALAVRIAEEV
jgi:hypothetical protein